MIQKFGFRSLPRGHRIWKEPIGAKGIGIFHEFRIHAPRIRIERYDASGRKRHAVNRQVILNGTLGIEGTGAGDPMGFADGGEQQGEFGRSHDICREPAVGRSDDLLTDALLDI